MSKSYIVEMWYKLVDKFGAENIHLIFTDTDSLAFELTGQTYKEAYLIYHHIKYDTKLLPYLTYEMSLMFLKKER